MKAEVVLVDSFDEAESFMRWLSEDRGREVLGFDVETTGLDPFHNRIRLAQFGDTQTGWAFPYPDWKGLVADVMRKYTGPMAGHNTKFDCSMLEVDGVPTPRHLMNDTMILCHLYASQGPKGLKQAATMYVDRGAAAGQRALTEGMRKAHWTWETVPVDFEPYWTYGALDPVLTCRLWEFIPEGIRKSDAYEMELAASLVLLDVELRGAAVDVGYCEDWARVLSRELAKIEARWPDVNLHATAQVIRALEADGVRLPPKLTDKGNQALDEEVLSQVDHPLARDTLAARDRKKAVGTYLGAYLRLEVDGLVHCNISPLGAERTGRMSISRPSMQNIPRRALERDAFVPRSEDNALVLADYSAQELRLLAHLCRDPALVEAAMSGEDMHAHMAEQLYGAGFTVKQRQTTKNVNYAKVYGAGVARIAFAAGVSVAEAKKAVRLYDRTSPEVGRWSKQVQQKVKERAAGGAYGWVVTDSGARLQVPTDKLYVAVNYRIQGGCAVITKRAMIAADRAGLGEYMILPVHDEILWDVPRDELDEVLPAIREAMETDEFSVPFPVEPKVVDRWGDAYAETRRKLPKR
jgi:DNA polymerase-1